MITLIAITVSVFLLYVGYIWIKYGKQKSVSNSYYMLPDKYKFVFTLFCYALGFSIIILGTQVTAFMFFAGASIIFVGASPRLKLKHEKQVHMVGAIGSIVFSQLAIIFSYEMWQFAIQFLITGALALLLSENHKLWWAQIFAFISLIQTVIIYTIKMSTL
jgi:hypothetical protein